MGAHGKIPLQASSAIASGHQNRTPDDDILRKRSYTSRDSIGILEDG